jgi:hypothetical protein
MKDLVSGSDAPGFATPQEALQLLEEVVLPSLDALNRLQAEKRILAGGVIVGEREFVFVAEAESNEKLDRMLREIPFWGMVKSASVSISSRNHAVKWSVPNWPI